MDSGGKKENGLNSENGSQINVSASSSVGGLCQKPSTCGVTEEDIKDFETFFAGETTRPHEDVFVDFVNNCSDDGYYSGMFDSLMAMCKSRGKVFNSNVMLEYCNRLRNNKYFRKAQFIGNSAFKTFLLSVKNLQNKIDTHAACQKMLLQNRVQINRTFEKSKGKIFPQRPVNQAGGQPNSGFITTLNESQHMLAVDNTLKTQLEAQYETMEHGYKNMFDITEQAILNPMDGYMMMFVNNMKWMQSFCQNFMDMSNLLCKSFEQTNIAHFINCIQQNQIVFMLNILKLFIKKSIEKLTTFK